jgi:uncharacterized membrane protein YhaH (DUF805 family)
MTFGAAIKSGFQNLTNFKGRARRSEFWWFYLFLFLVNFVLSFVALIPMFASLSTLGPEDVDENGTISDAKFAEFMEGIGLTIVISMVLGAITILLLLAVWVRRLHDAGYSGHWLWLSLIGLSIVPLIFAIFEGQRYPNQYGPDPKANEYTRLPQQPLPPEYMAPLANPAPPQGSYPPPAPASGEQTDPFAAPPN